MPRGGRRSTSWKRGQSGNLKGRPKKAVAERLQVTTSGRIGVCLDIAPLAARALRQRGLIAVGEENNPSALCYGLLAWLRTEECLFLPVPH